MDLKKLIEYIGVEKPIKIEIVSKTKKKTEAAYWGLYRENGILDSHLIRIYGVSTSRPLETLIAHELIHAWQEENGILDIHGSEFQYKAEEIGFEFGIRRIYIKGTDI